MYKVVVIDDEKSIQDGITNYIKFMNCGFEVIRCFGDGKDALEYISSDNDIDVVITDIRMDDISGIDIVKYIYENRPHIKTVIVSAYEEFEYARAAVSYNVVRFISKPTKYREIEDVMKKIYAELEAESETHKYKAYADYLSEILYTCVLNERKISKDNINELLMIMYDGNHQQIVNAKYIVFDIILGNLDEFIDTRWNYGKPEISKLLKNFLLLSSPYIENKMKIYQLDFSGQTARYIAQSSEYENISEMENVLKDFLNIVTNSLSDELKLFISTKIIESFVDINELVDKSTLTVSEEKGANLYSQKTIDLAIEYINKHYEDDISLYSVAKYVNLNSAYFSHFFKKNTGKNFTDYLLDLRIAKAKELILSGNLKTEEICHKVGYKSISYFCKIFKGVTGLTPRQFYVEEINKKL